MIIISWIHIYAIFIICDVKIYFLFKVVSESLRDALNKMISDERLGKKNVSVLNCFYDFNLANSLLYTQIHTDSIVTI